MRQHSDDSSMPDKERTVEAALPPPTQPIGDGRHKLRLSISLAVLTVTAGILPLVLYFALKYGAHTPATITLAVPSALFGASSLFSMGQRTWSLGRRESTSRPLGGGRWSFDYFHWNFVFGFCYITAIIAYATAIKPASVRVAALPLTLLILQVCIQLVVVQLLAIADLSYFCRISSMPPGQYPLRPAVYTVIEDVVAVDGQQGTAWRAAFDQRFQDSPSLRSLLDRISLWWGLSGLAVAALDMALIFTLKNEDVSWVIGWTIPWVWTATMSLLTYSWTKSARD